MTTLIDVILALLTSESWEDAQRIVIDHPQLLEAEADAMLQRMEREQSDARLRQVLEEHRTLLARCREVGIEQAFAEKMGATAPAQVVVPVGFQADSAAARQLAAQARHDPQLLSQLIQLYEGMLERLPPAEQQLFRAAVLNNLGLAYADLPTGSLGDNLTRAIGSYRAALAIYTPDTAPMDYAMVQNNLGLAYLELPIGDRGANLQQAITCFYDALRIRTPDRAPLQYATTQTNLGEAYRRLPSGNRTAHQHQAVACFQEALRFWSPDATSHEYAVTYNNLGGVYLLLFILEDDQTHLERAITCFQAALRVWTFETAPREYAVVQNNLGNAYADRSGEDRKANLEQALTCYRESLRYRTPEAAPSEYAETQNNLGLIHAALAEWDGVTSQAAAVACYHEALRFWTLEGSPFNWRRTQRNLANLHFAQQEWSAADGAYQAAIDAGEYLYRAGMSLISKEAEVIENADLYQNAAFAAARLGDSARALSILEHGKTRLLTEVLRLRVARPAGVPDDAWIRFEQAAQAIQVVQAGEELPFGLDHSPVEAYAVREQAARAAGAALDRTIEEVQKYVPQFLKAIDRAAIQALLPAADTALVGFCVTAQGSLGFVLSNNAAEAMHVIDVPNFTSSSLQLLVQGNKAIPQREGWIAAYRSNDDSRWRAAIDMVQAEVGEALLAPIVAGIPAGIDKLVFLPAGSLFVLPLHAALIGGDTPTMVCDRYQVSYAPSIEVLADIQGTSAHSHGRDLCAVVNPTADPQLAFTSIEGMAIARLFSESQVYSGKAGTKQSVITGVRGRGYVHFACHGYYDWNNPTASHVRLADGQLTLEELQEGSVDMTGARLVVLSACETGLADVIGGRAEEYVGLPAGFMLAGVPCVVSSLWAVPDLPTALLMEQFYHAHLVAEMTIAAALQAAQRWLRTLSAGDVAAYADRWYQHMQLQAKARLLQYRNYYRRQAERDPASAPFAHPYYWAAFTVNGI